MAKTQADRGAASEGCQADLPFLVSLDVAKQIYIEQLQARGIQFQSPRPISVEQR